MLSDPIKVTANTSSVTPPVEIFDIDLFENPKETIDALHRLGKKAIAYFSAGSYEPERPDSQEFHSKDLGKKMDGWPKEKWVDIRSENVRGIMSRRIELAARKGLTLLIRIMWMDMYVALPLEPLHSASSSY